MDNASNNDAFVENFANLLKKEEGIEYWTEEYQIRCFAHVLNLAVKCALSHLDELISQVSSSFCIT
jgi:hypothetical protein